MAEKYVVEFFDCSEMDAIEGKDIRAVMYTGVICNTETGNYAEFDFVPLTGEIAFCDEWDESNDEFFDCSDIINESALNANKRAFYIGEDGVPFIAEEIEDGMHTYRKYWRLFNSVDGYLTMMHPDYMLKARPIDSTAYMNAMIAYSWKKDAK